MEINSLPIRLWLSYLPNEIQYTLIYSSISIISGLLIYYLLIKPAIKK